MGDMFTIPKWVVYCCFTHTIIVGVSTILLVFRMSSIHSTCSGPAAAPGLQLSVQAEQVDVPQLTLADSSGWTWKWIKMGIYPADLWTFQWRKWFDWPLDHLWGILCSVKPRTVDFEFQPSRDDVHPGWVETTRNSLTLRIANFWRNELSSHQFERQNPC